jgi:hypothetical protein
MTIEGCGHIGGGLIGFGVRALSYFKRLTVEIEFI